MAELAKSLEAWGLVIGVLGIGLSVYLYFRSFRKPAPKYQVQWIHLISETRQQLPGNIEVYFEGQRVKSLTKSIITLWNDGRQTLDRELVATGDPIILTIEDTSGTILRSRIIKASRAVNQATIEANDDRSIRLSFDFFDPGDGIVIEILHTGEFGAATFTGTLKGLASGVKKAGGGIFSRSALIMPGERLIRLSIIFRIMYLVMAACGVGMIIVAYFGNLDSEPISDRRIIILMGMAYIFIGFLTYWFTRRRVPKSLIANESDLSD